MQIVFTVCVIILIYAYCIFPHKPRRKIDHLIPFLYAHRGLWNLNVPENSLPAFQNAVEHSYGIELDVQLTSDQIPVVFHDAALMRMCGCSGKLSDLTYEELCHLELDHSGLRIPKLQEVLDAVAGRVPLIVEIKTCRQIRAVCRYTAELLDHYNGPFCIESFDPRIVLWFRIHRPAVIRGQLAYSVGSKYPKKLYNYALSSMLQDVLGRPDFIAKDIDSDNISFAALRFLRPWFVGWTVQKKSDLDRLKSHYDILIFEGFIPETKERKHPD